MYANNLYSREYPYHVECLLYSNIQFIYENIFNKPVQIVEVQMGSILKETDIVRYSDIYGRVN